MLYTIQYLTDKLKNIKYCHKKTLKTEIHLSEYKVL